jgi:hypothetical protein
MPVDPVTSAAPPAQRPQAPAKTLNDANFGALVNQEIKAGLRPGPKMTPSKDDGFKSTAKPERFLPLNRNAFSGAAPLSLKSVEALGAATKHPLGPQKR